MQLGVRESGLCNFTAGRRPCPSCWILAQTASDAYALSPLDFGVVILPAVERLNSQVSLSLRVFTFQLHT